MKKALPWILVTIAFIAIVLQRIEFIKLSSSLKESNSLIAKRIHSFDADLGRAHTLIDSNGSILKELKDEIPKDIKQDMEDLKLELQYLATATFQSKSFGGGTVTRTNRSSGTKSPSGRKSGGVVSKNEGSSKGSPREPPVVSEEISFQDWRLSLTIVGPRLDYELKQRFEAVLVEGSRDGTVASYIRFWELDKEGERIEPALSVEDFRVVRRAASLSSFKWFNPKLEIALANSLTIKDTSYSASPEVSLSIMSYGETADDLSWRLLRVGVLYDGSSLGFSVSPVSYNLGKQLPLVSNVWLSPSFIRLESNNAVGLSLGGSL